MKTQSEKSCVFEVKRAFRSLERLDYLYKLSPFGTHRWRGGVGQKGDYFVGLIGTHRKETYTKQLEELPLIIPAGRDS